MLVASSRIGCVFELNLMVMILIFVLDRQVIRTILKNTDLLTKEKRAFDYRSSQPGKSFSSTNSHPNPESLATILVHDFLFSRRGISLSKVHKLRHAIEVHSNLLQSELARQKARLGVSDNSALAASGSHDDPLNGEEVTAEGAVRWMRVNTIKWSMDDALGWLVKSGWVETSLELLHQAREAKRLFARDRHLACLLALSPAVILSTLVPYCDGRLIAQDKASCMPPQLLLGDLTPGELEQGLVVIDATAAPGNKTTMLSALVGPNGTVWAFEKDPERFKTLNQMVSKAGCTSNVTVSKFYSNCAHP